MNPVPDPDPEFKSLVERAVVENDLSLLRNLISNYGTSYWRHGSFGNAVYIYVIMPQDIPNPYSTFMLAIDSLRRGSAG
jgi:hypothetical protein